MAAPSSANPPAAVSSNNSPVVLPVNGGAATASNAQPTSSTNPVAAQNAGQLALQKLIGDLAAQQQGNKPPQAADLEASTPPLGKLRIIEMVTRPFNKYFIATAVAFVASTIFMIYQTKRGSQQHGFIGDLGMISSASVAALLYLWRAKKIEQVEQDQKRISKVEDLWEKGEPSLDEGVKAKEVPYNRIIGALYLGNDLGFVSTTNLPAQERSGLGKPQPIDTDNPAKFRIVVSVCSLNVLQQDFVFDRVANAQLDATLQTSFKRHHIAWIRPGRALEDKEQAWEDLIFNSTYLNELPDDVDPDGVDDQKYQTLHEQKCAEVKKLPVKDWFEPTFKILDRAVLEGLPTLVHCQQGVSLSPALVAAYLIKRYGLTAKEAIKYLRYMRLCVCTHFDSKLAAYEKALDK